MAQAEMTYWWLSFVDPERPEGKRFLGGTIVAARDEKGAIEEAWRRGVNPGGEVMIVAIPAGKLSKMRPDWFNRLVSEEEIEAAGEK